MKKIKLLCAAGLLGALAMTSCTDLTEKVYAAIAQFNPFCLKNGIPYYFSAFSPWLPLRYLQCFPCRELIPSAAIPKGQKSRIQH